MESSTMVCGPASTQGFMATWPESDINGGMRSGETAARAALSGPGGLVDLKVNYNDVLGWLNMCATDAATTNGIVSSKDIFASVPELMKLEKVPLSSVTVETTPARGDEYCVELTGSCSELFALLRSAYASDPNVEVLEVSQEAMTSSIACCDGVAAIDMQSRMFSGCTGTAQVVLSHRSRRDTVGFWAAADRIAEALRALHSHRSGSEPATDGGRMPCKSLGLAEFEDELQNELGACGEEEEVDWTEVIAPLLDQACSESASLREGAAQQLTLVLRANPRSRRPLAEHLAGRPEVLDSLFAKPTDTPAASAVGTLATTHFSATMLLLASKAEAMEVETARRLRSMTASIVLAGTAKVVERDLSQVLQNLRVQ